jgi:2'-hydroxyisoflavone reductase
MRVTRRSFLEVSALAAGAVSLGVGTGVLAAESAGKAAKKLRILILGGTGFTGPHTVRYAVERGHQVTIFNRGRRQTDLPDSVERLTGDRNVDDYESLKGREWDAVLDIPTSLPRWVKGAGQVLQGKTGCYLFVSTISVYADSSRPGMDETTPLATGADPEAEQVTMEHYGALKALSEQEAEKWYPGRVIVVRPGLIVGPGDPTDRFTYWPVRISRGGEVLCPGTPDDPVQIIDQRDLAEWNVRLVEQRAFGIYNGTGPAETLTIGRMLETCKAVSGSDARLVWADAAFLEAQGVAPWSDMPTWVPPVGEYAGFSSVSVARAVAAGLTFRPLATTVRDTLDWWATLPEERRAKPGAGIDPEREAQVLAAWHARQKGAAG